jgi:hypothetical protein
MALADAEIDLLIATLADAGEDIAMARTIQHAGRIPPPRCDIAPTAGALVNDAWTSA